ncbi:MAG TPA: coenzyme F420-0:L-glutamate ligase [Vicinamibacterales bacterium]|nr:coenzyme F420-0:L-glutamate ligase [Vicinamibacterales bacterium]
MPTNVHLFAVPGIPDVAAGADLGALIAAAATRARQTIEAGDVVVVAQKIVSKAEGALVRLDDVAPSPQARRWGEEHGKDPRVVEVVLRESKRIVRMERGILIAETAHGFICANAGVDSSNVEPGFVTLLPRDPDASAARIRAAIAGATGCDVLGVVVSDTFGRPWREGVANVALGVAGLRPLLDYRGCRDPYGRELTSTVIAVADEVAAAAELVMGKTARLPVAVVRGAGEWLGDGSGRALLRDARFDLFR